MDINVARPDPLLFISEKQKPVIQNLDRLMREALANAAAVLDNAKDDGVPIPSDLVTSFQVDYDWIILHLQEAANV